MPSTCIIQVYADIKTGDGNWTSQSARDQLMVYGLLETNLTIGVFESYYEESSLKTEIWAKSS